MALSAAGAMVPKDTTETGTPAPQLAFLLLRPQGKWTRMTLLL